MSVSVSPLTGKQYPIPNCPDDREGIDYFLAKNTGKQVVVVQGLGFVGAVMSLVCANAINGDYAVIGVDLPNESTFWKIQSLNEGVFPLVADDPKIEEFYQRSRAENNFYATYDPQAYAKADVIIVDINLDVQKTSSERRDLLGYDVDLSGFRKAMESIGNYCRENALVLVETTVPPGTCEKVVLPILHECLQRRGLPTHMLRLGHSYERVMPGPEYIDSIQSFFRVFSGVDDASAEVTERFLRTIIRTDEYPLTRLGRTNATEMAKVLENSYRAMNIAFIVEWSRFAEEAGVDLYEVVKAIRMRPTHSNMMLPGIGVGGYCLTKDPLLASWARQNLFDGMGPLAQSERSVAINDKMPEYAFEYFANQYGESLRDKRVLLLGVSYRGEVGDTRCTPVELFYDCLLDAGAEVILHDPHVSYWEERDLKVEGRLYNALECTPDVIIICTGHSQYRGGEFIRKVQKLRKLFFYDTLGLYSKEELSMLAKVHQVKVLGKGDM